MKNQLKKIAQEGYRHVVTQGNTVRAKFKWESGAIDWVRKNPMAQRWYYNGTEWEKC